MPTNIEVKAKVRDLERLRTLLTHLSDTPVEVLQQHDTFFTCHQGRLKLRQFSATVGELIYYQRADEVGSKPSYYEIVPTAAPDQLRALLTSALGEQGIVRKTRLLYRVGQTRVHLDTVAGLGTFLELEVVLKPDQSPDEGRQLAEALLEKLEIPETELIAGAYVDLSIRPR